MPLKDTNIFGSQQMIRLYFGTFLIHLIRCYSQSFLQHKSFQKQSFRKLLKTNNDTETFNKIIDYLNRHITSHVTIDLICKDNLIGRSQLQKLFRNNAIGVLSNIFNIENRSCQRTDPNQSHEFYTDFCTSWLHLYSLFFQAIQKNCRNDTF